MRAAAGHIGGAGAPDPEHLPHTLADVPVVPEPPELARLLDFAERSRAGDWSLRSSLVRYAQSQPVRVSQVLELVRRIEAALHPHARLLAGQGP